MWGGILTSKNSEDIEEFLKVIENCMNTFLIYILIIPYMGLVETF